MYDHRKRPYANDNNPQPPKADVARQSKPDIALAIVGMGLSLALISTAVLGLFGPWPY